jgi:hypothetical protein
MIGKIAIQGSLKCMSMRQWITRIQVEDPCSRRVLLLGTLQSGTIYLYLSNLMGALSL